MMQVVQAFDRALIKEIPTDDAAALEAKLATAAKMLRDRDGWPKPHQRSAILLRAAELLAAREQTFATLIAREGGKPFPDALVEAAGDRSARASAASPGP